MVFLVVVLLLLLLLLFSSADGAGHQLTDVVDGRDCSGNGLRTMEVGTVDNEPRLIASKGFQNGPVVSLSGPLDEGVPPPEDGSGACQNLSHGALLLFSPVLVVGLIERDGSGEEGTAAEKSSFQVAARCVRVLDEVGRGVIVPKTDDQTDDSSRGTCCCVVLFELTSVFVAAKANGFCV